MRYRFKSDAECHRYLERVRWPHGLWCPRCRARRISKFVGRGKTGKKRRLYTCLACRYQYTVTAGTFLEDTHVPLRKWLAALRTLARGPQPARHRRRRWGRFVLKGGSRGRRRGTVVYRPVRGPARNRVTAVRLQRELRLGSYETAWRLARRIREAQQRRDPLLKKILPPKPPARRR